MRNSENVALSLGDFFYYEYKAYIAANKENAEKLFAIDYNGCISDMDRNKAKVVAKMKDLVKQSTKPNLSVENGEVGLLDYKDTVTKSKTISEQKYVINWLEIEK